MNKSSGTVVIALERSYFPAGVQIERRIERETPNRDQAAHTMESN
jgi:hypothetical protein